MATTPRKGIVAAEGKVFMRPGKNTNRMRFEMSISKTDEQRLLAMLKRRNPNAA
jgi:hypothetical protein